MTQAGGGWTEPSGPAQRAWQLLNSRWGENVGPALPDFQQTPKSAFRNEIPTPKVKSLHILNAMQAK